MTEEVYTEFMKYLIYGFAYLAVLYPVWMWYESTTLVWNRGVVFELFPVFGLIAFSTMWLHVVGGAIRPSLEKHIDFQKFVTYSSVVVFVSIILHPALLLFGLGPNNLATLFTYGNPIYLWLGIVAWFVLVGYDVSKKFKTREFFANHWETVRLVATLGFFLTLFHSLGLGRNLQDGPLRWVWIFYGVTALVAAAYTYGIKRFLKKS